MYEWGPGGGIAGKVGMDGKTVKWNKMFQFYFFIFYPRLYNIIIITIGQERQPL